MVGSPKEAFQAYKESGEFWNKFPKSDYTYSEFSAHRREISPGQIIYPNLSRKKLGSFEVGSVRRSCRLNNALESTIVSSRESRRDAFVTAKRLQLSGLSEHESTLQESLRQQQQQQQYHAAADALVERRRTVTVIIRQIFVNLVSVVKWLYMSSIYRLYESLFKHDGGGGWTSHGYKNGRGVSVKEDREMEEERRRYYDVQWLSVRGETGGKSRFWLFRAGQSLAGAGFWLAERIYLLISRLTKWDTWLLIKSDSDRRKRLFLLLLWLLLPFLLLGAFYPRVAEDKYGVLERSGSFLAAGRDRARESFSDAWLTLRLAYLGWWNYWNRPWHFGAVKEAKERIVNYYDTWRTVEAPPPKDPGSYSGAILTDCSKIVCQSAPRTDDKTLIAAILASKDFSRQLDERIAALRGDLNAQRDADFQATLAALEKLKSEYEHRLSGLNEEIQALRMELRESSENIGILLGAATSKTSEKVTCDRCLNFAKDNILMQNRMLAQQYIDRRLEELRIVLAARLNEDFSEKLKSTTLHAAPPPPIHTSHSYDSDEIRRIFREMIAIYDADKTAMVDYALETAGGQIISTRCTETYRKRPAQLSIFGIPIWTQSQTPRVVITPGAQPGQCWAFTGFPGYLVIQLSREVLVTGFTLEHIPRTLAPEGKIDSAPNEFAVYGLKAEYDDDPLLLGEYHYDQDGEALQYFVVENATVRPSYEFVELRIESNHGHPEYTCLYRFRVHGIPVA